MMVGGALITLLNNSDRVKVACLAQLVNVIGPIFTEPGGAAWRQTIFHPFKLVTQHARGSVLQTKVQSAHHETKTAGSIEHIVASAVHDTQQRKVVFFVLNRETSSEVEVSLHLRAFPTITGCNAFQISGSNLLATNTAQTPDAVQPSAHEECFVKSANVIVRLRPLSWNVLSLSY